MSKHDAKKCFNCRLAKLTHEFFPDGFADAETRIKALLPIAMQVAVVLVDSEQSELLHFMKFITTFRNKLVEEHNDGDASTFH